MKQAKIWHNCTNNASLVLFCFVDWLEVFCLNFAIQFHVKFSILTESNSQSSKKIIDQIMLIIILHPNTQITYHNGFHHLNQHNREYDHNVVKPRYSHRCDIYDSFFFWIWNEWEIFGDVLWRKRKWGVFFWIN